MKPIIVIGEFLKEQDYADKLDLKIFFISDKPSVAPLVFQLCFGDTFFKEP